jgi:hypothetical protein
MENNLEIGKNYAAAIFEICESSKIPESPTVSDLLIKIGDLRDKNKHLYNINGKVDFQLEAIADEMYNTRLVIGSVYFWKQQGLTSLRSVNTNYGQFRVFSRRPDFRDTWFYIYVDEGYSRIYNCWQRIANILNIFFKVIPERKNVYFKSVLDSITIKYPEVDDDSSYLWLKEFLDERYSRRINYKRKDIIHSECSSGAYINDFIKKINKPEEQDLLEKERNEWPELLLDSYKEVLTGVDYSLKLITNNIK